MGELGIEAAVIGAVGPEAVGGLSMGLAGRPRSTLAWARRVALSVGAQGRAQVARWVLWAPVAFGAGAASYFALKAEPPVWLLLGAGGLAALLLLSMRRAATPAALAAMGLIALSLAGFADGGLSTDLARTPVALEGLGAVTVQGWVVDIASSSAERSRLLIAPTAIEGLNAAQTPARVRLTLRAPSWAQPGDGVRMRAIVDPPPGPASPGGYDFARDAWFARVGGVGLALTPPRPARLGAPPLGLRLQMGWNALRWRLASRLAEDLAATSRGGRDSGAGGLAAAVSTSHEAWLSEAQEQDLRNSGLAHMLAIAGLHTAAVTGFVFLAVRLLVAAWPWLALRVSGKKLAAGAGLLAAIGYLALSGAHPPARRAAITAGVAFIAILCERRAVSMRSLSLAALVILALQPVAVVQPGFQMSFCATASLVAMAELWPRHGRAGGLPWPLAALQRAREWTLAMGSVSLIAGLATAPFALQHFNRMATYGLFANFAADLVASLALMPALVVAGVGEALGADPRWLAVPLRAAAASAHAILAIAHLFATLPGAVNTESSAPEVAMATAFLGIIFACLWRGWLRWVAAPLAGAVMLWPRPAAPVAWIAADGANAAVVLDGRMVVLKPKVRAFASQAWATRRALLTPFDPQAEGELAFDCDRSACIPRANTYPALGAWWSRRAPALDRLSALCRASEIVVLRADVATPPDCAGALVIGPKALADGGSAELFPRPSGGWRIVWAQPARGLRPWSAPAISVASQTRAPPNRHLQPDPRARP